MKKLLRTPRIALYLGIAYTLLLGVFAVTYIAAQLYGSGNRATYDSYRVVEFAINLGPFFLVVLGFFGSRSEHLPLAVRKTSMAIFWLAGAFVALLCVPGGIQAAFHGRLFAMLPALIIVSLIYSHSATQRYRYGGTLMP